MSNFLNVFIAGVPETKGSWIPLGGGRVKADNPREKAWAHAIGWMAKVKLRNVAPLRDRVSVAIDFVLPPRPNRTKKNQRDIDKLARSCLDALSEIAFVDDEQVDELVLRKRVAPTGVGATITVGPLEDIATVAGAVARLRRIIVEIGEVRAQITKLWNGGSRGVPPTPDEIRAIRVVVGELRAAAAP